MASHSVILAAKGGGRVDAHVHSPDNLSHSYCGRGGAGIAVLPGIVLALSRKMVKANNASTRDGGVEWIFGDGDSDDLEIREDDGKDQHVRRSKLVWPWLVLLGMLAIGVGVIAPLLR